MFQLLSYPIGNGQPAWPENPTFHLEPYTAIESGDVANTAFIHLFNHYGTHIDGPLHFYAKGQSLDQLPLDRFFYHRPLLIDLPKTPCEKILPCDLKLYQDQIAEADLLLIRTGFWKMRGDSPKLYEKKGPAVSSQAAAYLMDTFFNLKAIALDFVSLASFSDGADGDLAHQYMLGMYHSHFINIIEDVNLKDVTPGFLKSAAAIPLMIEGIDSSPVTMWAEL